MKISIFGLGYVGCVTASCLAAEGHQVIGVEVNPTKVEEINSGKSPIIEKNLNELIRKVVDEKRLMATLDYKFAVMNSNVSFICVGTPSLFNGSTDNKYLEKCAREIGTTLKEKKRKHLIVNRSTSLPGTLYNLGKIIEETSGKLIGRDFQLAANPEFLREGTAIADFYDPPLTVVGCNDEDSTRVLKSIYSFLEVPFYSMSVEEAEIIKYVNNAFHGLKVAFANEIGRISKAIDIDSRRIMDIVASDTKLNLSPYYLKPGLAFGGSCLPKDLRALTHFVRHNDMEAPLIKSILISNDIHLDFAFRLIAQNRFSKIGFLGFSFKTNTDDLRESPALVIAEKLIGKGNKLFIYDQNIYKNKLIGSNREFVREHLPHFFDLLTDNLENLIKKSEIIVVVQKIPNLTDLFDRLSDKIIVDLIGWDELKDFCKEYYGICW